MNNPMTQTDVVVYAAEQLHTLGYELAPIGTQARLAEAERLLRQVYEIRTGAWMDFPGSDDEWDAKRHQTWEAVEAWMAADSASVAMHCTQK